MAAFAANAGQDLVNPSGNIFEGYWHNWCDTGPFGYQQGTAPCFPLKDINDQYNVIMVSFMKAYPKDANDKHPIPTFKLDTATGMSEEEFKQQIAELNKQGKSVLISLGGADAHIELVKGQEYDLAAEIIRLVDTYGFDGLDIDLEQAAISAADNVYVITEALKSVKDHYKETKNQNFIIAAAPEFPYLRGGATGVYGKYLSALEGYYDWISPQFYNQGGDGISDLETGQWIPQNNDALKEKFIYSISKAIITGEQGYYPIANDKLVFGIPANRDAAATGFVDEPQKLINAFDRLQDEGTPLRGVMTWSINWDVGKDRHGNPYGGQFAKDYGPYVHGHTSLPEPESDEPVIHGAENTSINVYSNFSPMAGVTATDKQDGNLTDEMSYTGQVDTNTLGDYPLVYRVKDSDDNVTEQERVITVYNDKPVFHGAEDKLLHVGDHFDAKEGVTAWDTEEHELTSKIIWPTTIVDTQAPGQYNLTYSVSDSFDTTTVQRNITVRDAVAYPQYEEGVSYQLGDLVTNINDNSDGTNIYQCDVPGWCGDAAWAYEPGVGIYWTMAWSLTDGTAPKPEQKPEEKPDVESGGNCKGIPQFEQKQYQPNITVTYKGKKYTSERWTDGSVTPDQLYSGWSTGESC